LGDQLLDLEIHSSLSLSKLSTPYQSIKIFNFIS